MSNRCSDCGRFARYDPYYARWRCDYCDREVPAPPAVIIGFDGAKYGEIRERKRGTGSAPHKGDTP